MRIRHCLPALLLASCSVDLSLPDGVIVTCATDADCPDGSRCNPVTRSCAEGQGNLAPGVTIADVERATRALELAFTVRDANAAPFGDDRVSLVVEYSRDQTSWCQAVTAPELADLEASSDGVEYRGVLDLVGEAAGSCGLVPRQADTDGDGLGDLDMVTYVAAFAVRATPTDDGSPALAGPTATSSLVGVGNDAPLVEVLLEERTFRGDIPIAFRVTDSAFDPAGVEIQYRLDGLDTWRDALLRVGVVTGLETDGRDNVLVWNSEAPLVAGGIGARTETEVGLRLRAYDAIGGVRDYGPWAEATLSIDNQTAPVVQGIFAQGGLFDGVSGAISIEYRVSDPEADLVDVTIEYAMDDDAGWVPCTEYPDELSHGRYDLPTAEGRGVAHVFRWDAIADLGNAQPDLVRLRIQASDGLNPPIPATLGAVSGRVGMVVGNLAGFVPDVQPLAGVIDPVAMGDFNADGFADAAYFTGTQLVVRLGSVNGLGSFGAINVANDRPRMVVTRVNADGADDLLIRVDATTTRPFRGVPGAVTPAAALVAGTSITTPSTPDRDITAGDFDGDGDVDFAINAARDVYLYVGNGAGAFTADANAYGLPTDVFELAAGDFDGDGFVDLASASASPDLLAAVMIWFGQASPSGGPRLSAPVKVGDLRYAVDADAVFDEEVGVVLAAGNLNGDAFADLGATATELSQNGRTEAFLGGAARAFTRVTGMSIEGRPLTVRLGDVNGDGRADLVTTTDDKVLGVDRLLIGPPPVMQRISTIDVSGCLTTLPVSHAVGDVTGDGRAEIVVARRSCDNVLYLTPQASPAAGPGSFGRPNTVAASEVINALEVADVDSDGLLDAVWLDRLSDATFVFQATADVTHATGGMRLAGVGFFGASISAGLRAPFIADLNGDGLLDGVTHDGDQQNREWVLLAEREQGAGTFGLELPAVLTSAATSFLGSFRMDAFDLDRDGPAELVEVSGANVRIHRPQTVDGVWQGTYASQTIATGLSTALTAVVPADLDNDGVLDLVLTANNGTNTNIEILLANVSGGLPTGSFARACAAPLVVAAVHTAIAVADVNDDGSQELLLGISSGGNTQVRAYGVTFGPCVLSGVLGSSPTLSGGQPNSIHAADVNHDGIADIVALVGAGAGRRVWVASGLADQGKATGAFSAWGDVGAITEGRMIRLGDANRDGVLDLFIASELQETLGVALGNRISSFDAWSRVLLPANVLGAGVDFGQSRFGSQKVARLLFRPYVDLEARAPGEQRDFMSEVRASRLPEATNAKLRPLSRAISVSGDVAIGQDPDDETRYRVGHKLGTSAFRGLALDDPTAPRGVVVRLPVIPALSGVQITGSGARPVVVYVRTTDWVRASESPSDPLYQDPRGDALLPLRAGKPVILRTTNWENVVADADGDLTTGSGPRFVTRPGFVDVALDTLGVVQAFYIAP